MLVLLARTDQPHRQGFGPIVTAWEPPVDILETGTDLIVIIALPGVPSDDIEILVEHGELFVRGTRKWPCLEQPARVHRIELPHGRFERRLPLPPGAYRLVDQEQTDGCVVLTMRKLG